MRIMGVVSGSSYYEVVLYFNFKTESFDDLDCDCPYGDNCKHEAAVGLKFIELYEEFLALNNGVADENFSNSFVGWVDKQKNITKSSKTCYNKHFEHGSEIGEDFYDDDDNDSGDDEDFSYRSVAKKKKPDSNLMSVKELRTSQNTIEALEKLGVDTAPLSDKDWNFLRDRLKIKKSFSVVPAAAFVPVQNKKFEPQNFWLALKFDYDFDIDVCTGKKETVDPAKILKDYSEIPPAYQSLFEALIRLRERWEGLDEIDFGEIFNLIKLSGLKVCRQTGYFYQPTFKVLNFVEELEKIKAELYFKEDYSLSFFFNFGEKYNFKNWRDSDRLFCGKEFVVCVIDDYVLLYKIPSRLTGLISRTNTERNDFYRYQCHSCDFTGVKLKDEEIFELNQIIEDGKKYLDLKTDLSPDYNIKKFDVAEPTILVDFDASTMTLSVKAAVDYGFEIFDASKLVRTFHRRGQQCLETVSYNGYHKKIDGKNIFYAVANHKKEIKLFEDFLNQPSLGFNKKLEYQGQNTRQIMRFYDNYWPKIKKIAEKNNYQIKFVHDVFNFISENFKADFKVDLNAENDWLAFDVSCYGGRDKISLADLKKYVANKEEFIKMNDGRFLRIANFEELERFVMMLESFRAHNEEGSYEGKLYNAPELENIIVDSEYYTGQFEKSFHKFIKEVKSGKPVKKIKLPVKYDKVLRDYQKSGIDWLYFLRKYRFAGILADDMGLGKTLQALVLLEKERVKNKPSLIVCPKTLLYNWQSEAEKFTPGLKTLVVDGFPDERIKKIKNCRKYDLVITGYAGLQKDAEIYEKNNIKFNYCVLDEAQFIKNHATKNARIVKKVDADYRLALTGTPLENNVSEIWSIFDFLMPGFLGSYQSFVKRFQNPIMKKSDAQALANLRKKIACFMLRRAKSEVLKELPPKNEQVSLCLLEKDQNILYQEILASVKSEVFGKVEELGFNKSRIHILAGLTKLRQVCNHPVLLLKDKRHEKYKSAKLNMFLELIEEIVSNKRKVLVFSQFTQMLDILAIELKKSRIDFHYLSGKTKNRHELVKDFNKNEQKQVFLISLKAGGTGLNLTSADNVIIFDPWWNPSVENQAVDRTHRIGQKNSVNVYRFIAKGTIEEKIVALQARKKFLFDNLVGESKDLFQKLTWEEIKKLFE